jgi:nucleotide-binding universal stress UspA family protein
MKTFHKILFPVDMSDSSRAAASYVESLVHKFRADLTILHVLETPRVYFADWEGSILANVADIRDACRTEFNTFLLDRFPNTVAKRDLLEGDPAQVITTYAEDKGMDLIMMPTHGIGIFRSLLLGSVTAKVLHDSTCPIWTSVHAEEAPPVHKEFNNVMCAVDLTEESEPTMEWANGLAKDYGATLWLIHAVPGAETRPQKYFDAGLQQVLQQEARRQLEEMAANADIDARICLGAGDVSKIVREAALHHNADLLVAGRGHATRTFGRLRTNIYSIIREAPCPVISV